MASSPLATASCKGVAPSVLAALTSAPRAITNYLNMFHELLDIKRSCYSHAGKKRYTIQIIIFQKDCAKFLLITSHIAGVALMISGKHKVMMSGVTLMISGKHKVMNRKSTYKTCDSVCICKGGSPV